jgi:hypothetical protein
MPTNQQTVALKAAAEVTEGQKLRHPKEAEYQAHL